MGGEVYGRGQDGVRLIYEHVFVARHRTAKEATDVEELLGTRLSDYEIARKTGVSRGTIQRWRTRGMPRRQRSTCPVNWRPANPESYSYLLGIYLGDGYVSKASHSPVLEISLDARYPEIVKESVEAIWQVLEVRATVSLRATSRGESIRVVAGSQLWPLAFPQHGAGKKHERPIVLSYWQKVIVDRFPRQFLRGLLHSDGSRSINRFTVLLPSGPREYAYIRYFFTNLSADIRGLFCASCDQLGIGWTQSSHKNISIAGRQSVELLDSFVGPKR
jgi:hypothetical protein